MAGKVDIKDLFEGLQKQMVAQLSTNREFIEHPGTKGDSLEQTWIEWLRKYLPSRYSVDKAIIIDHEGSLSDQIDVVIYDQQYTPFVLTQNGVHYIPAEGVYSVFEVKPDFNGNSDGISYIEYASAKIASVRKLKRTSTYIVDRGRRREARELTKILGGVLASTNTIKKNITLEEKIKASVGLGGIDLLSSAESGTIIIDYDGTEDAEIADFNERIADYYKKRTIKQFKYSDPSTSLLVFFFQLTRYLQQSIGTVAAIDLNAYSTSIGFDLDKVL